MLYYRSKMRKRSNKAFCTYPAARQEPSEADPIDRLDVTDERQAFSLAEDGLPFVEGIGFTRYVKPHVTLPLHTHPKSMEMHYCLRGPIDFEIGNQRHTLLPGCVSITQPGTSHHIVNNARGHQHYWLLLRFPTSAEAAGAFGLPPAEAKELRRRLTAIQLNIFPVDDRMKFLFQDLFAIRSNLPRGTYRTLMMRAIILQLLATIVSESGKCHIRSTAASIRQLTDEIKATPEVHRAIGQMARECGLCESSFIESFKKATGFPPAAFITHCRIEKAKQLLIEGSRPIAQIADTLGYSSSAHFSSQFRLFCGKTPSAFRQCAASR